MMNPEKQQDRRLEPRVAHDLADKAGLIDGFPSRKEAAFRAFLVKLCRGGTYEGEDWPPERQARWLLAEMFLSKWSGTAGVLKLFSNRFKPPDLSVPGPGETDPMLF